MSVVNHLYAGIASTDGIMYDNSKSGLYSEMLQDAIDELTRLGVVSTFHVVLPANGWTTDFPPYKCRVPLECVDENSVISIFLSELTTNSQRNAIDEAVFSGGEQDIGSFTVYAFGSIPTIDINIKITVSNNI